MTIEISASIKIIKIFNYTSMSCNLNTLDNFDFEGMNMTNYDNMNLQEWMKYFVNDFTNEWINEWNYLFLFALSQIVSSVTEKWN